jgi:hypothetical protein
MLRRRRLCLRWASSILLFLAWMRDRPFLLFQARRYRLQARRARLHRRPTFRCQRCRLSQVFPQRMRQPKCAELQMTMKPGFQLGLRHW